MAAESFEQQWKFWVDNKYTQDWLRTSAHANFLKHKHKTVVSEMEKQFSGRKDKFKMAVYAYYDKHVNDDEIRAMELDLSWYKSDNTDQKKKLKKLMLVRVASKAIRDSKSERGNVCAWCQLLNIEGEHKVFHDDHIFPLSLGGSNEDWNIQTLCESHNSIKSSFPIPIQNQMSSDAFLNRHIQHLNDSLNQM